jgi:hypothetical protein
MPDSMDVLVIVDVRMRNSVGAAEEPPRLMRRQISDYGSAGRELDSNSLERVGLHYRTHYLPVHGQRHINRGSLNDSGPVLVAKGVAKLQASAYENVGCLRR